MVKKDKKERKNLDVCMWLDDEPKVEEKMIYYIKADKKIKKYLVKIDNKRLKELEEEILTNCTNSSCLQYIINKLVNSDVSAIDDIYQYQEAIEKIDKKIIKLENKMKNINTPQSYYDCILAIDAAYFKKNRLDNEMIYINKIKNIISFELVDTIANENINDKKTPQKIR